MWAPVALGTGAYLLTRKRRTISAPLEPLQVEEEPDLIILSNGNRAARSFGRLAEIKEVKPKRYGPNSAPGIDPRGVTVVTSGSRFIELPEGLPSFNSRAWGRVQTFIRKEEARGDTLWQEIVRAVGSKQRLGTVKSLLFRWGMTQRFRLAGIRPGMSPAQLYAVVTMAPGASGKSSGMPWYLKGTDATAKRLYPFVRKHRSAAPEVPALRSNNRVLSLLSVSAKVIKGVKKGYWTGVSYLSPFTEAGYNVCKGASVGCSTACLGHSSGMLRGELQRVRRIRRTLHLILFTKSFVGQMVQEIGMFRSHAFSEGLTPTIRLNGSSDIPLERPEWGSIPSYFPDMQFYDYSKLSYGDRAGAFRRKLPDGRLQYHLTFSYSEKPTSLGMAQEYLRNGGSAAVVIGASKARVGDSYFYTPPEGAINEKGQKVFRPYDPNAPNPLAQHQNASQAFVRYANTYGVYGFGAVDGDETDARFLDPPGSWVALYAKGAFAARDETGFVVRVSPDGRPLNMGTDLVRLSRRRGRRNAQEMIQWYEESLNRIC